MSNKAQLSEQRSGTVINGKSKNEDKRCMFAVSTLISDLQNKYHVKLEHVKNIYLCEVVEKLKAEYPKIDFHYYFETSRMSPDGGITFLVDKHGNKYPILIIEAKNQGTNDYRESMGKKKQAKGNAIERLGKNVIGLRTYMLSENIFPFICFGDGCDFAQDSSILDRVVTIAMFGELNKTYLFNQGNKGEFNRGSYYFKTEEWKLEEIMPIINDVATRSIYYYFSKYGEETFR